MKGGGIAYRYVCVHEVPVPANDKRDGLTPRETRPSDVGELQTDGPSARVAPTVGGARDEVSSLTAHSIQCAEAEGSMTGPGNDNASSAADVPLVGKRMRGEVEIAVLPDNSHRYIRGQRTLVWFQLMG